MAAWACGDACAKGRAACRADLYAGTNAFGACEYVEAAARKRGEDRRCVYATVLRNPIDRVESSWRYFCLNGAERRKGWTNAMKRAGRCSYSLERWAQTQSMLSVLELSTNQAPASRDAPVNQSLRCAPLADGVSSGEPHTAASAASPSSAGCARGGATRRRHYKSRRGSARRSGSSALATTALRSASLCRNQNFTARSS